MDALAEQIAALVRREQAALCIGCVAVVLQADPHRVHHSLSGLALLDEFYYAVECSRCSCSNEVTIIVGPHALDRSA